jgi:hypothetical protein
VLRDTNWLYNDTNIIMEPISQKLLGRIAWTQLDFEGNKVGPGSYLLRGEFRADAVKADYTAKSPITIVPAE